MLYLGYQAKTWNSTGVDFWTDLVFAHNMYNFATEASHMRHVSGLSSITAFFLFWKSLTFQLTKMKTVIFQISFLKSFMLKSHTRIDFETTNFDTFKICTKGCCLEATDQWMPFGIFSFTCQHHPHVLIYTVLHMTHSCRMRTFWSVFPFAFILSVLINCCIVLNVK